MNWKTIIGVASGATLGTVCVQTYFYGFDGMLTLLVGFAAFLAATFMGYIATLGQQK